MLTADYAFGHDLLKGAKAFLERNGGTLAGDDLVPTDATDFSSYMLKIRGRARPRRAETLPAPRSPAFSSSTPNSD